MQGCKEKYTPKPRGYFRIEFPEKVYQKTTFQLPFDFEYPVYSVLKTDNSPGAEPNWYNIDFANNKAKFHLSYKVVNNNLQKLTEESRELAYKHAIKAFSINEKVFVDSENRVFGTIYQLKGNTASPMQFHLTDSSKHFLRGSVYISEVPNYDSLQPVIDFLVKDVDHLIKTFRWN